MLKNLTEYRSDTDSLFRRMEALERDAVAGKYGHLLFRALPPGDVAVYSNMRLDQYDYASEADIDRYVSDLCGEYARGYEARTGIADDAVPVVSPILGIGDYSAFLGGDIVFAADTSWSRPILEHVEGYKDLPPLGSAPWYRKFLGICERIMEACGPSGIPFTRGFFSPMDLAGALRGDKLYYDFYDAPEALHGLLDYCADATIIFAEDVCRLAEKHLGGTKYGAWYMRGKINMSEDISCMLSAELYREFAAPHTQKVIDHFGVGYMHCHSRAMYLVKEICALKHVASLWLATDPGQARPIEHVRELAQASRGVCVAIDCERFEEIERNRDELAEGNFSVCLPVRDIGEAQAVTERFRNLRA